MIWLVRTIHTQNATFIIILLALRVWLFRSVYILHEEVIYGYKFSFLFFCKRIVVANGSLVVFTGRNVYCSMRIYSIADAAVVVVVV